MRNCFLADSRKLSNITERLEEGDAVFKQSNAVPEYSKLSCEYEPQDSSLTSIRQNHCKLVHSRRISKRKGDDLCGFAGFLVRSLPFSCGGHKNKFSLNFHRKTCLTNCFFCMPSVQSERNCIGVGHRASHCGLLPLVTTLFPSKLSAILQISRSLRMLF